MLHSAGMRLAPAVFVRGDILRFGKVGRALIQRCVQIIDFNQNPMRYTVVAVAAVIVRRRWKAPVNGLTHAREPIWFGSPFRLAEYGSEHPGKDGCRGATTGVTAKATGVCLPMPKNACLSQDWPICSNRSVLSAPPLIR